MTSFAFGGKIDARRKVPFFPGGCAMVILVPWKPIALVLGLLSALILVSYFGSALMRGKDPFAVSTGIWQPAAVHHATSHSTCTQKSTHRAADSAHR